MVIKSNAKWKKMCRRRGDVYYSPRRYLFSGALGNLLLAYQGFDGGANIYRPRFARAIILWIMFFEAGPGGGGDVRDAWKSVQKCTTRDQSSFRDLTLAYEIGCNNTESYFDRSARRVTRKHWSAFTRRIPEPTDGENFISFFRPKHFERLFRATRL